jgi:hypothetical protein
MSNELYKAQAARLVKFLSEHHKFRLKQSTSLEAIAAIHGFRNWNTLVASASDVLRETSDAAIAETTAGAALPVGVQRDLASEGVENVALLDLFEPASPESLENMVAEGLLKSAEPNSHQMLSRYARYGWRKGNRLYLPELKVRDDIFDRFSEHLKQLVQRYPSSGRRSVTVGILKGFLDAGWLVTKVEDWEVAPEFALWNIRVGAFEWKNMIILDLPENANSALVIEESVLNIAVTGPLFAS